MGTAGKKKKGKFSDPLTDYISERIQDLLMRKDLSKYRLAQRSGLSLICITRYIDGTRTPTLASLQKLCDGFEISLSQFFEGVGYHKDPKLSEKQNHLLAMWEEMDEKERESMLSYGEFLLHEDAGPESR
ncbi:MAG: helix-turn-helix domain-containing protein [Lachnospiraceae bacterium]|nr:helix-turn-helix domain-containing protein [Lachnospiraceae bacterium]